MLCASSLCIEWLGMVLFLPSRIAVRTATHQNTSSTFHSVSCPSPSGFARKLGFQLFFGVISLEVHSHPHRIATTLRHTFATRRVPIPRTPWASLSCCFRYRSFTAISECIRLRVGRQCGFHVQKPLDSSMERVTKGVFLVFRAECIQQRESSMAPGFCMHSNCALQSPALTASSLA